MLDLAVLKTLYRFEFKRISTDFRGSGRGPGEVPERFEKDLGGFWEVLRGSGRSVAFPDRSGEVTGGFGRGSGEVLGGPGGLPGGDEALAGGGFQVP